MKKKKDNHKKNIKKKRIDELPCGLCLHYWGSSIRRKNPIGRVCPVNGKEINFDNHPCKEFKLSEFFYCENLNFQSSYSICINRVKKALKLSADDKNQVCHKCQLGWKILLHCEPPKIKIQIKGE